MNPTPEFSFLVNCDSLKEAEKTYEIEANDGECAALAKRFELLSLNALKVKAVIIRQTGDLVHLRCDFSVDVVQACIVTNKPLQNNIRCTFERTFSASAEAYFGDEREPAGEAGASVAKDHEDGPEPPDPLIEGSFDLGETVAEQLSLEIDPFPRLAGSSFDGFSSSGDDDDFEETKSPFAVLEQLKKKS